jgi:exosortase
MRSLLLERLERLPYLPLIALIGTMWPVWQWLAVRAASDTSDAWALVSLVTAAALIWRDRARAPERQEIRWELPALLILIYAASYPFAFPLVRAVIAMSALAAACSALWFGRRIQLWLWGLLLCALPLVPSLNFYAGYPLRVVVGDMTSLLLRMNGFAVWRDGAVLVWDWHLIAIDTPCSGIKMLWTGAYLSCALAGLLRFDAKRTLLLGVLALPIVIVANVLRAAALFYAENGIVPEAQSAHQFIGVVVFALAAISIAAAAARLRGVAHAR